MTTKKRADRGIEDLEDQVLSDLLAAAISDKEEVDHEERPTLKSIPLASYPEPRTGKVGAVLG